jgi:hypothetical protein
MTDNKLDVTVMLLGSGQPQYLDHRKQVRTHLIETGIKNVVIMEEETDKLEDISLDDKFRRITNEQNPEALFSIRAHRWMELHLSLVGFAVNIMKEVLTRDLGFLPRKVTVGMRQLHISQVLYQKC